MTTDAQWYADYDRAQAAAANLLDADTPLLAAGTAHDATTTVATPSPRPANPLDITDEEAAIDLAQRPSTVTLTREMGNMAAGYGQAVALAQAAKPRRGPLDWLFGR